MFVIEYGGVYMAPRYKTYGESGRIFEELKSLDLTRDKTLFKRPIQNKMSILLLLAKTL